jgi:hypothetical protein
MKRALSGTLPGKAPFLFHVENLNLCEIVLFAKPLEIFLFLSGPVDSEKSLIIENRQKIYISGLKPCRTFIIGTPTAHFS